MSTTEVRSDEATEIGSVRTDEMKLEVVVIPLTDADRQTVISAVAPSFDTNSPGRTRRRSQDRAPSISISQATG